MLKIRTKHNAPTRPRTQPLRLTAFPVERMDACGQVLFVSVAVCAFLSPPLDLRRVGEKFALSLVIIVRSPVPDPFQTSGRLALLKAFYLSAGEEKPAPKP